MRLPDFIGVGPPRTGTTWLDRILRNHVGLPAGLKETQFFVWRYHLGLDWYAGHFAGYARDYPTGEFGPAYFPVAKARVLICQHMPACRIVITLREPVERFYSHYKMWRKIGVVKAPFEEVVDHHEELIAHTQYVHNVMAWREQFSEQQTLVLIYEDTRADRQGYVDRLCDFIRAPRLDLKNVKIEREPAAHVERAPKSRRTARRALRLRDLLEERGHPRLLEMMDPFFEFCMGRGEVFPPLSPDLEARLRERFRPEVEQLENLLSRDLSVWRT
ncbi:MAG TPA: sulfotransferase domain-containing protein [Candidatus Binataceae bacterium]|nr:sulfotransferase domain-containing protein [Candidatus Binataceae bacterium]